MGEHSGGIRIVKIRPSPIRFARQAQRIEGEPAFAGSCKDINDPLNVVCPNFVRHVTFHIEYSACDRELGNFRRLCSDTPLMVVALAVKLPRSRDHAWGYVITGETASVINGAKKPQEVPEAAAKIDDGSIRAPVEKTQELPVTLFVRIGPIPIDALRRRAVRFKF
jgi:hypothetical protein